RDLAGTQSLALDLPEGATVAALRAALAERVPALAGFLPRCAVAVSGEFAGDDRALSAVDDAAGLPPVSGGWQSRKPALFPLASPAPYGYLRLRRKRAAAKAAAPRQAITSVPGSGVSWMMASTVTLA